MSEEKTLHQLLDAKLEKLAADFLGEIKGYDIPYSSVAVYKNTSEGVSLKINFGILVQEKYTWEAGKLTPLEQQVSDLAKQKGFDFSVLHSGGSGDGYTNRTSLFLGTVMH